MKSFITLITFLFICFSANAQSYNYKKLSAFKNDTIAFMKYNFDDQRDYFIGKKFEKLLKVYRKELSIRDVAIIPTSPFIDPKGDSYVEATCLEAMDESEVSPDTAIAVMAAIFWVRFKAPYIVEYFSFCRSLPEEQTQDERANSLKDFIVDDIIISPFDRRGTKK